MILKIKTYGILLTALLVASNSTPSYASCVEFMKEAGAAEGVVPRFGKDKKIRAYVIYSDAAFLVPKRSLIGKARRKATLKAKREFAEFLKTKLNSETIVQDMMEQVEKTDQDGNTEGMAEEISSQIDVIRTNTSEVLSGLIKLDECVDKKEKVVMVAIGWKPSLAEAAADTKQKITKEVKRGDQPVKAARRSFKLSKARRKSGSGASRSSTSGSSPGIKIIVVKVEGIGSNLKRATNEALRSAVAQVFGEQFASQTKTVDLTDTAEVTAFGKTIGTALERTSTREAIATKTKGIIHSYSYLKKQKISEGLKVFMEVKLPKYETGMDSDKIKTIVLRPKLSSSIRTSGGDMDVFNAALQDTVESILNRSRKLTVLDRRFLKDQMTELNTSTSNATRKNGSARVIL